MRSRATLGARKAVSAHDAMERRLDLQALHPVEDSVVLLSGGLDSLIGAINLVGQGRVRKTNRLEWLLEILLQFVLKSITINRFYCQGEV
jgi:hypothetical protein